MIAAAKPKKKKASDNRSANDVTVARRGDEFRLATARRNVAKINRLDDRPSVSDNSGVEPAAGDSDRVNESAPLSRKTNGRSKGEVSSQTATSDQAADGGEKNAANEFASASICRQLQELQRRKAATLKSRIMIDNQLAALVSTELGYHAGMEESERKGLRAKAEQLIKAIDGGDEWDAGYEAVYHGVSAIVQSTRIARNGFDTFLSGIEKEMIRLAKQLPTAKWIDDTDRRGFGILSLATVIGETGDLALYANPAKVWKRLGLAPFQGKMPSTWRKGKEGKLSAEQWTEIGYSPRRRSIMFVVGENIVKQNKGSYRKRYDEAKAAAHVNHPDWSDGRCHWHGMLLATKRLVRDLWKAWNSK